ncbi:MAG: ATP-grasp domain-containing protein, partial [Chloroflexi bacterium]|nr:ATP-grasp domain-containing protein [Chloroflexota bacterium]
MTDEIILPLSAARERFAGICQLALADSEALAVARDKIQTLRLAESLGVPTPRTLLVHTAAEAAQGALGLGWPVVLKPQVSRLARGSKGIAAMRVGYAESEAELIERMRYFETRCPVLLQEYYGGIGCGVELLMNKGRPLAAFQHRRLREFPVQGGASAFRESVALDPTLYRHAVRLLEALDWTGLAMVEFKVGEQGAKLMEINGRIWGSLPLAVRSGMDFPALLGELYTSRPPATPQAPCASPEIRYKIGVRARDLELELLWIASVLVYAKHGYRSL